MYQVGLCWKLGSDNGGRDKEALSHSSCIPPPDRWVKFNMDGTSKGKP